MTPPHTHDFGGLDQKKARTQPIISPFWNHSLPGRDGKSICCPSPSRKNCGPNKYPVRVYFDPVTQNPVGCRTREEEFYGAWREMELLEPSGLMEDGKGSRRRQMSKSRMEIAARCKEDIGLWSRIGWRRPSEYEQLRLRIGQCGKGCRVPAA